MFELAITFCRISLSAACIGGTYVHPPAESYQACWEQLESVLKDATLLLKDIDAQSKQAHDQKSAGMRFQIECRPSKGIK